MRWAGYAIRMSETRNPYRVLVGKTKVNTTLGRPRSNGRIILGLILEK
jgi:hypothetical protein